MYSVFEICDYCIIYADKHDLFLSNLKLQKLLYFLQAEFLVNRHTPLFQEDIEAWGIGPVIPQVYLKYKVFAGGWIPGISIEIPEIYYEDTVLIDSIIDVVLPNSVGYLTELTMNQTPWRQTYYSKGTCRIISQQSIWEYFMED